jgi:hypothetical protein
MKKQLLRTCDLPDTTSTNPQSAIRNPQSGCSRRLLLKGLGGLSLAGVMGSSIEEQVAYALRQAESGVDVQGEFERHLVKLLRRDTELKVVESGRVEYPSFELDVLSRNSDFWRALGERLQSDLLLAGSLDFDVQDRSGYRTEEYVSPFDGRTYYRQVLVEQTGFEYDIVLQVYDGRTGALLYTDNFKDFKQAEGEKADPLQGMFENCTRSRIDRPACSPRRG